MKTISPGRYALSVCAAAAMLAGCGGSAQFPSPIAAPRVEAGKLERPPSPSTERLKARKIGTFRSGCGGDGFDEWCDFRARGKAKGPLPGPFTARCVWHEFSGQSGYYWTFKEHFTITSGTSKVIGLINAGGSGAFSLPGVYQYTTRNGYSGNVEIQSLGVFSSSSDFLETFYGM
jgi:hypothetical protein